MKISEKRTLEIVRGNMVGLFIYSVTLHGWDAWFVGIFAGITWAICVWSGRP